MRTFIENGLIATKQKFLFYSIIISTFPKMTKNCDNIKSYFMITFVAKKVMEVLSDTCF